MTNYNHWRSDYGYDDDNDIYKRYEKPTYESSLPYGRRRKPETSTFKYYYENRAFEQERVTVDDIHAVWRGIRARCYYKTNKAYDSYGGRGISLSPEWFSFSEFLDWCLENGYEKGLHLDRIDNDGDYSPNNCQFITSAENQGIGKKRMSKLNKTGFNGVGRTGDKFTANLTNQGIMYRMGTYNTEIGAGFARTLKEIELFGEQKTNMDTIRITIEYGEE